MRVLAGTALIDSQLGDVSQLVLELPIEASPG